MIDIIIGSVIEKLDELKAEDIKVINLEDRNLLFKKAILATGSSSRHVLSLSDNIRYLLKQKYKIYTKSEGHLSSEWILIDAGNFLINILQAQAREKYNLEEVWRKIKTS
ncbi:ribosome silencing factor [Candidatus Bandiella numerosa]|uniref:ribosome silencing factor n=1 Tax=Candidatus Bandiella numerosa TaxID=2570586 RepID=UPI001F007415|nr:ribosome silencing factor [Candidatus Bandiella numerosa]